MVSIAEMSGCLENLRTLSCESAGKPPRLLLQELLRIHQIARIQFISEGLPCSALFVSRTPSPAVFCGTTTYTHTLKVIYLLLLQENPMAPLDTTKTPSKEATASC